MARGHTDARDSGSRNDGARAARHAAGVRGAPTERGSAIVAMLVLAGLLSAVLAVFGRQVSKSLAALGTRGNQYDNLLFADLVSFQVSRRMESFLYWVSQVRAYGHANGCPVAGAILNGNVPRVDGGTPPALRNAYTWFDVDGTPKPWDTPLRQAVLSGEMARSSRVGVVHTFPTGAQTPLASASVQPFYSLSSIQEASARNFVTNWLAQYAAAAPEVVRRTLRECLDPGAVASPNTSILGRTGIVFCTYFDPTLELSLPNRLGAALGPSALTRRLEGKFTQDPYNLSFYFARHETHFVDAGTGDRIQCDAGTDFLHIPARSLNVRTQFFQVQSGPAARESSGSKLVQETLVSGKMRREVVNCADPRLATDPIFQFVCS